MSRCSESFDTMLYELISLKSWECIEVLFKICFCWLAFSANSDSFVFIEISWWASLKKMSSSFINTSNKNSNTEWSLTSTTSFYLWFSCNLIDESLNWMWGIMSVPVIKCLISHIFVQESSISCKTWEYHTNMVINIINFFLMFC